MRVVILCQGMLRVFTYRKPPRGLNLYITWKRPSLGIYYSEITVFNLATSFCLSVLKYLFASDSYLPTYYRDEDRMSGDNIERIAIQECAVSFTSKLDSSAIFENLIAQGLLTEDDQQVLMNATTTRRDKAKYIMLTIPSKGDGWFDKLLHCLQVVLVMGIW